MTLVVDTSVLIQVLRGDTDAQSALEFAIRSGDRVTASVLSRVEVLAGMRPDEAHETQRLFESLEWIGVDSELADRAGELASSYLRSHPGIDPVDYVIAATSEHLGAALWTHNLKHFPMFPGLQRPY
ncbi:MAG: type II toxin-antitoxin system VapC family toxin [Chloroflexota bacterium]|nr:type II toxin-antitoxin system VapC family toxin [Chloroflexota bacterium]